MTQALNQTLLARATAKLGPQASLAVGLLVLAVLLAMPLLHLLPADHALHVSAYGLTLVGKILCYAIVALALDLVWGYAGLLSLGLVLVIARLLTLGRAWREPHLAIGFWGMNVGLGLMVGLSLLPIGLAQAWASVEHGLWFARSAEFLQQPVMETLRWLRIIGDTVFLAGVAAFAWFMAGLVFGWSYEPQAAREASAGSAPARVC